MNIETNAINTSTNNTQTKSNPQTDTDTTVKFSDELKELEAEKEVEKEVEKEPVEQEVGEKEVTIETTSEHELVEQKVDVKEFVADGLTIQNTETININEKIEIKDAIDELSGIVVELNQLDDKSDEGIKKDSVLADNNDMINNDFNVENKDLLPQMNPGMSFNSNGQPFSSFMNEEAQKGVNNNLTANAADLAEESAILSTMAENIAIANKNNVLRQEVKTNVVVEQVVKSDTVIMNEADVEVFTQLVQKGSVDMNNLAPQTAQKAVQVSKTLADMLAKSMETNQPLRIDFDNDISVIIRISRDGKITADFLPSSQVAEAYLKENLPLLRQKFDNENIKYDELNQKERREHHKEQNRKKGRNDE